ncbi:MAG: ester cyclase [Solirubrobacteraceae bacterium]
MTDSELAVAWVQAWSGRDPTVFAAICEPDLHYEDPLTPAPLRGPAALGDHARRLWEAFPDVRMEAASDPLADAARVAMPVRLLGTHTEAIEGLPPSGRPVRVHALCYAELAGGRLHRVRTFLDVYDAGTQLGVLPRRGTLGEKALLMLQGFGLRSRS